ncbi:MAG: hypothetical protein HY659_08355 [Rhizobiales bacterium]|nr:hypothetical protein [Hyphomicrobiales bacterium]
MRAFIAGVAGVMAAGIAPAQAAGPLSPTEIQETFFNGKPFTAATPAKVKFKMVYAPDGKVTREPIGKGGVKGEGTWTLNKEGFCTSWKSGKPNCFRLLTSGNNRWSVMQGATVIAIWTK